MNAGSTRYMKLLNAQAFIGGFTVSASNLLLQNALEMERNP